MKLYDASTEAVKQGGTRRGANMGILRVDHPDVLDFISCKEDLTQVVNFNISVGITRKFMDALKADGEYELINPATKQPVATLKAKDVWDKMILGAWRTGEPGVFFIDEANKYNPVPHLGEYEATNPCGEQPLLSYDVCNLGSVNIGIYADNGSMDWESLRGNLPAEPLNVLAEDPDNEQMLYLGSDRGLYVSLDAGASWRSLQGNLPTVPVVDLFIHRRDKIMIVATHGRGVYVLPLAEIKKRLPAPKN